MAKEDAFQLTFPNASSEERKQRIVDSKGSIVIVGANGTGKTKLGTWIEFHSPQASRVHRISAQKSLTMPLITRPDSLQNAKNSLFFGGREAQPSGKMAHRWHSQPDTAFLNDFSSLLVYLVTDNYEQTSQYKELASQTDIRITPPVTKLDMVKTIWEGLMPRRKLKIGMGQIEVYPSGEASRAYNASAMSDGERVMFYLIGQVVSVPENGIVVIDEPELHLHKLVQGKLWDALESERPDCLFVYLTHELEFAASRVTAKKVCLREFDSKTGYDWFEVPPEGEIPEEIFLKIIGSRKPVLFVEGDKSSLDYFIFSRLFPDHTIVPRGSSDQVIQATMSFNGTSNLHFVEAFGVIDRDQRNAEELEFLKTKQKVFSLDVAEVENLLLTEGALSAVAAVMKWKDVKPILDKAKGIVFTRLESEKEQVASKFASNRIEAELKRFAAKTIGEPALNAALKKLVQSIDVGKIYKEQLARVEASLRAKDYNEAIKLYSNKGLLADIARLFGLSREDFIALAKRVLLEDDANLAASLSSFVPKLQ